MGVCLCMWLAATGTHAKQQQHGSGSVFLFHALMYMMYVICSYIYITLTHTQDTTYDIRHTLHTNEHRDMKPYKPLVVLQPHLQRHLIQLLSSW